MSKVKTEVFELETALPNGDVVRTKRIKYRCPKCDKSITSKYFNYCPYCGEHIEFEEGETK